MRCHQHLDTAPPLPAFTTFTFSATYVNGSTVKYDKRSSTIANIRKEGLKDVTVHWPGRFEGKKWSPVPIIFLNMLPIRGNTWYFDVHPPHAVTRRPRLITGYKNANLAYLKIAPALNWVKTGKLQKYNPALGPRYTDTTPCIQDSTHNYDRERF